MSNYNLSQVDIQKVFRILNELADLAHHATVTGFLKQGRGSALQRYNAILAHLEQAGYVPQGLFLPLTDTASFDELNIEARLLASYIDDDVKQARKGQRANQNGSIERQDIREVLEEVQELRELK